MTERKLPAIERNMYNKFSILHNLFLFFAYVLLNIIHIIDDKNLRSFHMFCCVCSALSYRMNNLFENDSSYVNN